MLNPKFTADLQAAESLSYESFQEYKAANKLAWAVYAELNFATAWNEPTAELQASYEEARETADRKLQAWKEASALLREERSRHAFL